MNLAGRIKRLEQMQGAPLPEIPELDLAPDILLRIAATQAAGSYPQSLTNADLEAILAAVDKARGQA